MTKEEIAKFAYGVTLAPYKTEITFKNGSKIYGYFEGNVVESKLYFKNKWKFVIVPQDNNEKKQKIFEGDKFHSIVF